MYISRLINRYGAGKNNVIDAACLLTGPRSISTERMSRGPVTRRHPVQQMRGTPPKHLAHPSSTRGVPFPSLGLHPNINIITLWWGYGDTRAPQTSRECLARFSALVFSLGPNPTRRVPHDNVLKGLSSFLASSSSFSPTSNPLQHPAVCVTDMSRAVTASLFRVCCERTSRISEPIVNKLDTERRWIYKELTSAPLFLSPTTRHENLIKTFLLHLLLPYALKWKKCLRKLKFPEATKF